MNILLKCSIIAIYLVIIPTFALFIYRITGAESFDLGLLIYITLILGSALAILVTIIGIILYLMRKANQYISSKKDL